LNGDPGVKGKVRQVKKGEGAEIKEGWRRRRVEKRRLGTWGLCEPGRLETQ
jgi:hypothetical protein